MPGCLATRSQQAGHDHRRTDPIHCPTPEHPNQGLQTMAATAIPRLRPFTYPPRPCFTSNQVRAGLRPRAPGRDGPVRLRQPKGARPSRVLSCQQGNCPGAGRQGTGEPAFNNQKGKITKPGAT